MKWIEPDSPDYHQARAVFNAMIDRRPAVIAQCSSDAEVAEALRYGREKSLPIAVRAGGHSVAGMSTNDGGLVVDVRPMKSIHVDPDTGIVTAGAGLTWGEFDHATQEHGLAVTGGRASTTGVAGFTLGGGSGWLERSYGFACDSLLSVNLVTADGDRVTASATENPDLFWALHGGGGNFGVATSFTFQAHRVGPVVHAGLLLWPGDAATDITPAFRDLALAAPAGVGSGLIYFTAAAEPDIPDEMVGKMTVGIAYLYAGDPEEGAEHARPFSELGPAVNLVGDTAYSEFQSALNDPPDHYNYWSADHHDDLPDEALDLFVQSARNLPDATSQQIIFRWGGAVGGPAAAATPLMNRNSAWVSHPYGISPTPEQGQRAKAWVKDFREKISPYATGGTWLNFIGNEGQGRIRAAFGEQNYARLARVKREFDPQNVFRGNQNILPAEG